MTALRAPVSTTAGDNRLRCPVDGWGLDRTLDDRLLCPGCDREFELVQYWLGEVVEVDDEGGFT